MTTRPHARYRRPDPVELEALNAQLAAAAAERAATRVRQRQAVLELVRRRGQLCPTEAAPAFNWSIEHARGVLVSLEAEGLLTSEHRPAPRSGNGRRYYSVVQP